MNKLGLIKCVIFDCDGTLIDSERLCIQAQVDVLESVGVEVEYQWLKQNYQGTKIDHILGNLIEDKSLLELGGLNQLIARYRARCNQLFSEELVPIEGVIEVLDTLLEKQILICIASNAPHEKMDITLPLTNLAHYFDGRVYSAYDAKKWKPDPGLIHFVMDKMSVTSEECLFIDDSLVGIEAGVKAGVKTLYFAHDTNASTQQKEHQLLYRITALKEILQFV
ncbi:HAD-IA family hydrolase [Vibrio harveyi]|nr:HAD-IA family hydrolase [Vibrio harveyi]